MPVLDLLLRELLMLLLLALLGAGPAALLSRRFELIDRVALTPVLGLALGAPISISLLYLWPAATSRWLLLALLIASVCVAVFIGRSALHGFRSRALSARSWRGPACTAAVLVVVAAAISATPAVMVHRFGTPGPFAYQIGDASLYLEEASTYESLSLRQIKHLRPTRGRLEFDQTSAWLHSPGQLDYTGLSAEVDALFGLQPVGSWEAFLLAVIAAGGLGMLACVRRLLGSAPGDRLRRGRTLAGAVGGLIFAGPFFLQLLVAGSQASLCGLALLLPLAVVTADVCAENGWAGLLLEAILLAALYTVYPLYLAAAGVVGIVGLIFLSLRVIWLAGPEDESGRFRFAAGIRSSAAHRTLGRGLGRLVVVLIIAVALNLFSFLRDVTYWHQILNGTLGSVGQPPVFLPTAGLPGWLLGTRSLYKLSHLGGATFGGVVTQVLIPLLLLGPIVLALLRRPRLLFLAVLIAACAVFARHEVQLKCQYCTDRSLLPIGPAGIALVAVGLGLLFTADRPVLRLLGIALALAWLVPAGRGDVVVARTVEGAGGYLNPGSPAVLKRLPRDSGRVEVEGFDTDPNTAPLQLPYNYDLVQELTDGRASLPADSFDYSGTAYLYTLPLPGPQFDASYRYVLTRAAGVQTERRVIARRGPIALEQRTQPVDVTLDSGFAAPRDALDPAGRIWASSTGPLRFVISGAASGASTYLGAWFDASVPVHVSAPAGTVVRRHGHELAVCVPSTGAAPVQSATFSLGFKALPGPNGGTYGEPPVGVGVRLTAMAAATGRCPVKPR